MLNLSAGKQTLFDSVPLTELNRRYIVRTAAFEAPLDAMALDLGLFLGNGESRRMTSLHEVHPLIACLPWLLREAFPCASEDDLCDIAEAGIYLMMALLLQDHYIDGQVDAGPKTLLLHQQLHTAGIRRFHFLFDAVSPFWRYFEQYLDQYTAALIQESRCCSERAISHSMEEMYKLGSGKVALLKTVTTASALRSGAEIYIVSKLEAAVDALAAALQLGDDITDWADDYEHQRYTLPLILAIPVEQWPAPRLSVEEVGDLLKNSFILDRLVRQVIEWLRQAVAAIVDFPCPLWTELVASLLARARSQQISLLAERLHGLAVEKRLSSDDD